MRLTAGLNVVNGQAPVTVVTTDIIIYMCYCSYKVGVIELNLIPFFSYIRIKNIYFMKSGLLHKIKFV
jgi:hypothetical protein